MWVYTRIDVFKVDKPAHNNGKQFYKLTKYLFSVHNNL